jgi:hypothetical protein
MDSFNSKSLCHCGFYLQQKVLRELKKMPSRKDKITFTEIIQRTASSKMFAQFVCLSITAIQFDDE